MTEAEKEQLVTSLEKEAQVILTELAGFAKPDVVNPDFFVVSVEENDRGLEDNATDLTEYERLVALANTLTKRLVEIRLAIKKIKAGEYGKCEHCSVSIQSSRLLVMPVARYCIECAKVKLREA